MVNYNNNDNDNDKNDTKNVKTSDSQCNFSPSAN